MTFNPRTAWQPAYRAAIAAGKSDAEARKEGDKAVQAAKLEFAEPRKRGSAYREDAKDSSRRARLHAALDCVFDRVYAHDFTPNLIGYGFKRMSGSKSSDSARYLNSKGDEVLVSSHTGTFNWQITTSKGKVKRGIGSAMLGTSLERLI